LPQKDFNRKKRFLRKNSNREMKEATTKGGKDDIDPLSKEKKKRRRNGEQDG